VAASVFYRWQAEQDLAAIYEAIPVAQRAREFVRSIEDRCDALLDFPRQGRARDDLGPGLRIVTYVRRVVIAYRIRDDGIEVVRVFYGGRNYEALLRDTGDE
jgi:toxin ParE1/3/4